jgi:uncharacterized cupin superfamily protein
MLNPSILSLDQSASLPDWPMFPESEISSGARDSRGQVLFEDPSIGLTVGIWESEANLGRWMTWPVHEFMIIVDGEVVVIDEIGETVAKVGDCFFIPKGKRCIWNQSCHARKIMMMFEDRTAPGADAAKHIFRIDTSTALSPSLPPNTDILASAKPEQMATTLFRSASAQLETGLWRSSAYSRKQIDFPHHELMHLLSGNVTFTEGSGAVRHFTAGDTLFVPKGTPNAWHSTGPVHKVFCSVKA